MLSGQTNKQPNIDHDIRLDVADWAQNTYQLTDQCLPVNSLYNLDVAMALQIYHDIQLIRPSSPHIVFSHSLPIGLSGSLCHCRNNFAFKIVISFLSGVCGCGQSKVFMAPLSVLELGFIFKPQGLSWTESLRRKDT